MSTKTLHINVADCVATYRQRDGDIVCGNNVRYEIEFTFDGEWSAHSAKIARFVWNGEYFDVDITSNKCTVPAIDRASKVEVGVYVEGGLCTTTSATIPCVPSILCRSDAANPGFGQNYTVEAKAAAESAKASVDAVTVLVDNVTRQADRVMAHLPPEVEHTSVFEVGSVWDSGGLNNSDAAQARIRCKIYCKQENVEVHLCCSEGASAADILPVGAVNLGDDDPIDKSATLTLSDEGVLKFAGVVGDAYIILKKKDGSAFTEEEAGRFYVQYTERPSIFDAFTELEEKLEANLPPVESIECAFVHGGVEVGGGENTNKTRAKAIVQCDPGEATLIAKVPPGVSLRWIIDKTDGSKINIQETANADETISVTVGGTTTNVAVKVWQWVFTAKGTIGVVLKKNDDSDFTSKDLASCLVVYEPPSKTLLDMISELGEDIDDLRSNLTKTTRYEFPFEHGSISAKDGKIQENTNTTRAKCKIPCDPGEVSLILKIPETLTVGRMVDYGSIAHISNPAKSALPDETLAGVVIKVNRYTFTATGEQVAVTLENASNNTTVISDAELACCLICRDEEQTVFEVIESLEQASLKGKKMASLGDSITYGYVKGGQIESYAALAAKHLGMTFVNRGISGSTVGYKLDNSGQIDIDPDTGKYADAPMSLRVYDCVVGGSTWYDGLPNDADIVTFMGGTNDVRKGIPLGTFTDRTETTYYGALHTVMKSLYKKYFIDQGSDKGTQTKVIICTPIKNIKIKEEGGPMVDSTGDATLTYSSLKVPFDEYIDAIKEVAAYYSFPVLDFYNTSMVNPHILPVEGGFNPYVPDGTHPNKYGAKIMAAELIAFIKNMHFDD